MVQTKYPNKPITKAQIKKIHILVSSIGLNDDYYRALLSRFDVESSTELNREKAAQLIDVLVDIEKEHLSKSQTQKPTGVHMQGRLVYFNRAGKATNNQIEYIAGLWLKLSNSKTYESLMWFIKKIIGVLYLHIESLQVQEASHVIVALEKWNKQKEIKK